MVVTRSRPEVAELDVLEIPHATPDGSGIDHLSQAERPLPLCYDSKFNRGRGWSAQPRLTGSVEPRSLRYILLREGGD